MMILSSYSGSFLLLISFLAQKCFAQLLEVNFPIADGKEWRLHGIEVISDVTYLRFCHMTMGEYQREPWKYPMDPMLATHSSCDVQENSLRYSLESIIEDQNKYPEKYLHPSGFIHHETRCGSTLVANMIAHTPDNLMVSESAIPYTMFFSRENSWRHLNESDWQLTVTAVFRSLCLTQHGHTGCFFKLPGGKYIKEFQDIFPDTPWIFIYRNPVDVVVSNLKGAWGKKDNYYKENVDGQLIQREKKKIMSPCLQMTLPRNLSHDMFKNNPEKHCVLGLENLCSEALAALKENPTYGAAVEYSALPDVFYDHMWVDHFGQSKESLEKNLPYMMEASVAYSKTMYKEKAEFHPGSDVELKEKQMTDAIRVAIDSSKLNELFDNLNDQQKWT